MTTYSDPPKVSTIIINHNAGQLLSECIAAALDQVDKVILVDNASTDNSIESVIEHFATDPRLKVIYCQTNIGFAAGCNLGVCEATETDILFLNPDCILQPNSVKTMLKALHSSENVCMVGGLLINPDGTEQGGGRRAIPTPWRSFVRAFGLYRFANRWPSLFFDFYLHKQPLPKKPVEVEAISGACMLVKREAMDDIGHWDEGYFLHCEDLDWCMRFRKNGWKILFVPDAQLVHHHGTCSRARPFFVEWHKHKGMVRFYRKFFKNQYPGFLMWFVSLGVWIRFIIVATFIAAKRVAKPIGFVSEQ